MTIILTLFLFTVTVFGGGCDFTRSGWSEARKQLLYEVLIRMFQFSSKSFPTAAALESRPQTGYFDS